jgi:predicted nucleotidyltransferase
MSRADLETPPDADNMIPAVVANHLDEIRVLCRKYGVLRLDLFGSAVKGTFNPESSDLDFVASFADRKNLDYADRYLDFADALEALFERRVDLVTEQGIKNPYFREEIEETRRRVYVAPGESAAA